MAKDIVYPYLELIESIPALEMKGKTMPYTSINGNMSSFLDKEGNMGLRLSANDRKEFIEKFDTALMVRFERTMKEYVFVSAEKMSDSESLIPYFQRSFDYVSYLKPKISKKK